MGRSDERMGFRVLSPCLSRSPSPPTTGGTMARNDYPRRMNIEQCYRLLELDANATLEQVKAAYRRLARQYHPDVNPDKQRGHEQFIALTEAYKVLLETAKPAKAQAATSPPRSPRPTAPKTERVRVKRKPSHFRDNTGLSELERQLKRKSYAQLQELLRRNRFPRAIALVEGLAQRLPQDIEVRQWLAIAYQRWGHYAIERRQFGKARTYLKKALRTDPHNRSLWVAVERDFRLMERLSATSV